MSSLSFSTPNVLSALFAMVGRHVWYFNFIILQWRIWRNSYPVKECIKFKQSIRYHDFVILKVVFESLVLQSKLFKECVLLRMPFSRGWEDWLYEIIVVTNLAVRTKCGALPYLPFPVYHHLWEEKLSCWLSPTIVNNSIGSLKIFEARCTGNLTEYAEKVVSLTFLSTKMVHMARSIFCGVLALICFRNIHILLMVGVGYRSDSRCHCWGASFSYFTQRKELWNRSHISCLTFGNITWQQSRLKSLILVWSVHRRTFMTFLGTKYLSFVEMIF